MDRLVCNNQNIREYVKKYCEECGNKYFGENYNNGNEYNLPPIGEWDYC